MFIIRKILGSIILFFSWVFTPKGVERETETQSKINKQTVKLKLYQFNACPFCIKVRRAMKKLSLNIETRDAMNNAKYRNELASEGGAIKVPCLRIEDEKGEYTWMYESSDIIKYLQSRFG